MDQAKDTGLAIVLLLLLIAYFWKAPGLLPPAIGVLAVDMVWPRLFAPAARVWFGLGHAMGAVSSTILLSLVFALVTTPVGRLRRLLGADSMRIKRWGRAGGSVFVNRDKPFVAGDLEHPY